MIAMQQIWVLHPNGQKKLHKLKNKRVNQYQNQSTCPICHQNYLFPYNQNRNLKLVQTQHAYWILINVIEIHFKRKQQNCNPKLLICLNYFDITKRKGK